MQAVLPDNIMNMKAMIEKALERRLVGRLSIMKHWIDFEVSNLKESTKSEQVRVRTTSWEIHMTHSGQKYNQILGKGHQKPAELVEFMKYRDLKKVNLPDNVIDCGRRWKTWWRSIQPSWRIPADVKEPLRNQDYMPDRPDWSGLAIAGENGIVLAIVGLAIWSMSIDKCRRRTDIKDIGNALMDVDLVLQMMLVNWHADAET